LINGRESRSAECGTEQFGLPEYWIVGPESRTIEVFALVSGSYAVPSRAQGGDVPASKVPSGFKLSFADLDRPG